MSIPSTDVRGKRIRFAWKDGPTKGTTHEHVFHRDGTVEWHAVKGGAQGSAAHAPATADRGATTERPKFADEWVGDDVRLVSYLSSAGYTLTVALNFADATLTGIASSEKTWTPVHGSFEVVEA